MIYLDNAATTFPKPARVRDEVNRCIRDYCGNPGRGSHPLALAAAEQIYLCREALSDLFGVGAPERIVFLQNTTHALNLALKGLLRQGDHVLISELEHNAVRRPLLSMAANKAITVDVFPVVGLSREQLLRELKKRIKPATKTVVCTHASNICSIVLPIGEIGAICRRSGLLFIVDAAQSAGVLPINMQKMCIDALAAPAHKSLYGIQGCGVLALGEGVLPTPLFEGGSGVNSLSEEMPDEPPERYEAGTLQTPAIVGLLEGVRSLPLDDSIFTHERALFRSAKERLTSIPDVTLYAPDKEGAVLLFNKADVPSVEVGAQLAKSGICVRAGLHCAPMAHKALGTPEGGAVRVSFGRYNTIEEIDRLWKALK